MKTIQRSGFWQTKGDNDKPDIRSRLVACEVKGPPRCFVSLASENKRKVLDFVDIRKSACDAESSE